MIQWLSDPIRAGEIAAWSLLSGIIGLALTLAGLGLTYLQAKRARISADQLRLAVTLFGFKKDISEALSIVGEAKASMESAGPLIRAGSWREAASSYDDARKSIQKVRLLCSDLTTTNQRSLRLIRDHLTSFANEVEAALAGKGELPEDYKVLASIRLHSDQLTVVQREIQEAIK